MKVKSFDKYLESRLNKKEIEEIKHQAKIEFEALKNLQTDVARTVAEYMSGENIGFNELVRRLGISPSKLSKIQNGDANLTLASIAHISALLGRKAKIVFEDAP